MTQWVTRLSAGLKALSSSVCRGSRPKSIAAKFRIKTGGGQGENAKEVGTGNKGRSGPWSVV